MSHLTSMDPDRGEVFLMRKSVVLLLLWVLTSALMAQETRRIRQIGTRPSADNDRTLREISEEEIPPNLNFYAMDPLYDPNAVLGWAEERIEEKLNRGLVALPSGENRVYLSWRLLREDPTDVGFHVYRAAPGQQPVRLTSQAVTATTVLSTAAPYRRRGPRGSYGPWWLAGNLLPRSALRSRLNPIVFSHCKRMCKVRPWWAWVIWTAMASTISW